MARIMARNPKYMLEMIKEMIEDIIVYNDLSGQQKNPNLF
jgi:hypothetical protein